MWCRERQDANTRDRIWRRPTRSWKSLPLRPSRSHKKAMFKPRCVDFARALCYNFNPEPIFRRLLDHFFLDGYQGPMVGPISRSLGLDISRSFSPSQIRRKPSPQIPLLNSRQSQPRGIPLFPKHAQKPLPLRPSTDGHAVAAVCPRVVPQRIGRVTHKVPPGSTTTHAVNPLVKQPQVLKPIVTQPLWAAPEPHILERRLGVGINNPLEMCHAQRGHRQRLGEGRSHVWIAHAAKPAPYFPFYPIG